jgi:hypothetical protein
VLLGITFCTDVLIVSEKDPLEFVVPNISSVKAELDEFTKNKITEALSSPVIFNCTLSPLPVAKAESVGVTLA